ncbi:TPA: hypothetical protein ACGIMR_000514 [Salmonella enterica subsp. enterica serovar Javiana]
MFINQHQRDELELAFSCTDHYYQPQPKPEPPKGIVYSKSGFTREDIVKIATDFYQNCGNSTILRNKFFKKKYQISYDTFKLNMQWFGVDVQRYYRVDGGKIYRMIWTPTHEIMKRDRYCDKWVGGYRNDSRTFQKGHADTRELFVDMENLRLGHYFNNSKEFYDLLRRVDIGRTTYYTRLKKYGIKREFFMSIDGNPLFPYKCRSVK